VYGKFLHQGQICLAINRILVDGSLHDAFVERFVERTASLSVGDPNLPDTVVGPVISPSQLERIERLVEETIAHGAHAVLRGEKKGLLLWPTVLIGVTNDMPAAQQEIFGPVASIVRVEGDEDAVRVANETEYGLSSAVISRDAARAVAVAKRIEAGMTHVNDSPIDDEPNTAFGGEKASGLGRFGGRWAIEEFTTDHWISVQEERRRYPF
jgi:aldehyde dehydrogenase (NAD+)